MPGLNKPQKIGYVGDDRQQDRTLNANQRFYNSTTWRKCSTTFREKDDNLICHVQRQYAPDFPLPSQVTDHIISINAGGARWDDKNFIPMSRKWHDIKRGIEAHKDILVDYKQNWKGEKVPLNKQDIIDFLIKHHDRNTFNDSNLWEG